ncbi:MAG: chemotaxis-specific protein-glutamate methyltransferase CheB [Deltaproteobacteria bacterium]|nr:chemotaxis-specific protein-glutamate methyltransferase CheB [Deltaproteobacteria bacterium]
MDAAGRERGKIKVLLVDDSMIALTLLKRMLSTASDIEVAGTAGNGKEALALIPELDPAVVITDLHMPVMGGLEFTKEVMARYPRPLLVVSVSVQEGSHNVFNLLEAGAVDVFPKPRSLIEEEFMARAEELKSRIRILAGVHVFRRVKKGPPAAATPVKLKSPGATPQAPRIVAIGASTGGPQALQSILGQLPPDFPLPIVCVQHIGDGFLNGLIEWLGKSSQLSVMIAPEGEAPRPGTVYFPPEGAHLVVDETGRFRHSHEGPVSGHCPSVTMTFKSIAARYGAGAIGTLLTGMGADGAEGMKAIADAGGATIAQDEKTSVVFGMPRRAIDLGAAGEVLPLDSIATAIAAKVQSNAEKGG